LYFLAFVLDADFADAAVFFRILQRVGIGGAQAAVLHGFLVLALLAFALGHEVVGALQVLEGMHVFGFLESLVQVGFGLFGLLLD